MKILMKHFALLIAGIAALALSADVFADNPHQKISPARAADDAPSISAGCSDPAKGWLSTSQGQTAMARLNSTNTRQLIQGISVYNEQPVLGPGGVPINSYGNGDLSSLSDEHSTIFPPGTFKSHPDDYLFFAAPKGVVVLTGGAGPNAKGQWTLDYASDFGHWLSGQQDGEVFAAAMAHLSCPTVEDVTQQDPTFDLNYALPGSVVIDPTNKKDAAPGNLLMVYEGTNRCMGSTGKNPKQLGNFYATVGIATSDDDGHSWPAYVSNFTPLPTQNPSEGPNAPYGAWGRDVCKGGEICVPESASNSKYGRYAILSPSVTLRDIMADADHFTDDFQEHGLGDAALSAFVDTVHKENGTYLYVVYEGNPGNLQGCLSASYPGTEKGLKIARAKLNGGTARLLFTKWYGPNVVYENPEGTFDPTGSEPNPNPSPISRECPTNVATYRTNQGLGEGAGGLASPIFPRADYLSHNDSFKHCQASVQGQTDPSISYVPATSEYLLTFVCTSPSDPLTGAGGPGAAWFYSTLDATLYDLSHQEKWSAPQEIVGSWAPVKSNADSDGWYPAFMTPLLPSGTLGTSGYVFYLKGPINDPSNRQYTSRQFNITTTIGSATLISPSGTITTATPTYTWEAVSKSIWYYLWVNDSTGNSIKQWYTAAKAGCSGGTGTCSIAPGIALAQGSAIWRVETWNSNGDGRWSDVMAFTVAGPAIYTITASAGPNGAISPLGAVSVSHGSDQAFAVTPAALCHVVDVLVDGVSAGAVPSYTFHNVTTDHTISANFAINPKIAIISPNGGETWYAGTKQTIQWTYTGDAGTKVKIKLLKAGKVAKTLTPATSIGADGKGFFGWSIPLHQTPGYDYRIKIVSTTKGSCSDVSDKNFSIIPPLPISVLAPNGGKNWKFDNQLNDPVELQTRYRSNR